MFITNSQSDQLPIGLIAQSVRAFHWYCRCYGFEYHPTWSYACNFLSCTYNSDDFSCTIHYLFNNQKLLLEWFQPIEWQKAIPESAFICCLISLQGLTPTTLLSTGYWPVVVTLWPEKKFLREKRSSLKCLLNWELFAYFSRKTPVLNIFVTWVAPAP